ncbi:microtubule-associated protein futsch-like [Saccostrea cucullata]|uniref:microtubule-associated protein futsch-like n=1 Tax=Saccostrea cuccullata TaxID=36930 RepID=UPI002ED496E9
MEGPYQPGYYDPSYGYDYSQFYAQGGPPPPNYGVPPVIPQGPTQSSMPSDPAAWAQSAMEYKNKQMATMANQQISDPSQQNPPPPPTPAENQLDPSQEILSIPVPPPPSEPHLPSSVPLPQPQPPASDIPLPPLDVPLPPSSSTMPTDSNITQDISDSNMDISIPQKKALIDMDVPALSPAEPEEVKNVSECIMPSGEKALVVETTPLVGLSPTAELLEMESKQEICDNKQSESKVDKAKPDNFEDSNFENKDDASALIDTVQESKDTDSEKIEDNKDNLQSKAPVKTTAQMLLEKIAMKKKATEATESGEVSESVVEGSKPKTLKPSSKFLLQQLKQDAGKVQFNVKLGASGTKKGNILQKTEKSEADDSSKHKGGSRELYKPSAEDKVALMLETMTPKQRDSYMRYKEQQEREARKEERRKQREQEREKQIEEKDIRRRRDKSESIEKDMNKLDIKKVSSSPKTDSVNEQVSSEDKRGVRKSEERTKPENIRKSEERTKPEKSDGGKVSDIKESDIPSLSAESDQGFTSIKHNSGLSETDNQGTQKITTPQSLNVLSPLPNTDSCNSSQTLTSKVHSVKIITVDKSKDMGSPLPDRKKKSRWSEMKADVLSLSVPSVSSGPPTAVPMVTDAEVYSPDHPTESPKTALTGDSQMYSPEKPTGMEYSPSHPTEDYSPSRPTDTPSPSNGSTQVDQSSRLKDEVITSDTQTDNQSGPVADEQSHKESGDEDTSSRKSKKKKSKKKLHRSTSHSPERKKKEKTKEKLEKMSPQGKDSFSWDSDEEVPHTDRDSKQRTHSRSRSYDSADDKSKEKSIKSVKKSKSPKHKKHSQSRSRSRSVDSRSRKKSTTPRKHRSRSKSDSRSIDSTKDTSRKYDVKSRSSLKHKSRSRSRSSSVGRYSRKDKSVIKTSRHRSRSRSADPYQEHGRKKKSTKKYSSHSKSINRSRSRSQDSGKDKSARSVSPRYKKKSLSPKHRKTSYSRSRSKSSERAGGKKKKTKKKQKTYQSSSRSRSRSVDAARKHKDDRSRSISPKPEKTKKKKPNSTERSRSPSPAHTKSDRRGKSNRRQSESPMSSRRGRRESPRRSVQSSVSPHRRRNSSSPDYRKRSSTRKKRNSVSPSSYQSDEDRGEKASRRKSRKGKDKSSYRDSPIKDISKDARSLTPDRGQEKEPKEDKQRETSPEVPKERAPISFKMNINKPVKKELPSLENKLDDSMEKDIDEGTDKGDKTESSENLVHEQKPDEKKSEKHAKLSKSPSPSRISTHSISKSPAREFRSRSKSVDSEKDKKLSKKAKKAAKKAKKKAKKLAKEKKKREREAESSSSPLNYSNESIDIEEKSEDVTVEDDKIKAKEDSRNTGSLPEKEMSPESKKVKRRSWRSKRSNSDEDSQQTSPEQGGTRKLKRISVDIGAIPLPGQEISNEQQKVCTEQVKDTSTEKEKDKSKEKVKDSSKEKVKDNSKEQVKDNSKEQVKVVSKEQVKESSIPIQKVKKLEQVEPIITDLSSIPMPDEMPVKSNKSQSISDPFSVTIPDTAGKHDGEYQRQKDTPKPSEKSDVGKSTDDLELSQTEQKLKTVDESEVKDPESNKEMSRTSTDTIDTNEEKIKRELKKLNIDMVKSTFDLEEAQPRRRSRRSYNSTEKEPENESNEPSKRTTRRRSKASLSTEDSSGSENSKTDTNQSESEVEKPSAEIVQERQEVVEKPTKRKRKSRFSDVDDRVDVDQIVLPTEKKSEVDLSTLPKVSVTLEPIHIEKSSARTPIKFALASVTQAIEKVKWDEEDEESQKEKGGSSGYIPDEEDTEISFKVKVGSDTSMKEEEKESNRNENVATSVKVDVPAVVTYPGLSIPNVSADSIEGNEGKGAAAWNKNDIFQTALKKAKELVESKVMASVEEPKKVSSDVPTGEDNTETVDMECDSNSNSQEPLILQGNENYPQNSVPNAPMTTFPKFTTVGLSLESIIPDFGVPLGNGPSSTDRKSTPPAPMPPIQMNIPPPPPSGSLTSNLPIPPPQPVAPPTYPVSVSHPSMNIPLPGSAPSVAPLPVAPPPVTNTSFSITNPPNIPLPQSSALSVLPTDIPLPPPPPEKKTSKEDEVDISKVSSTASAPPNLPSDIPMPPDEKTKSQTNPPSIPIPPEKAKALDNSPIPVLSEKKKSNPCDIPMPVDVSNTHTKETYQQSGSSASIPLTESAPLPEVIPLPSEIGKNKSSVSMEPLKVGLSENQGTPSPKPPNMLPDQEIIVTEATVTNIDASSRDILSLIQQAETVTNIPKLEERVSDADEAGAENGHASNDTTKPSATDIQQMSSIELSKQALLAKVIAKQKENPKEKKLTIGKIPRTSHVEKSTEKSKDEPEMSQPIKKTPMIKIGPIVMSKGKDSDTTLGESSEDGEIKSESENESHARHRIVSELGRNLPISPLVMEKSHGDSNPGPSGFGVIPKKVIAPPTWTGENPFVESNPHNASSASESEESKIDDREYYKKVDEFLKKVEKPKTTVERKFDEFLEKVRKPKPDSPSLEEKVDEFLKKTEKKDSRERSYDEYTSSKHERDDYDRDRDRDRDLKDREYRDREKDRDNRDRDRKHRDREYEERRRERDKDYGDRHREREHDDRRRDREKEYDDRRRDRDKEHDNRRRDRDHEERQRDRDYEDRHREREHDDRYRDRNYDDRHRKRERRGSRERSRSRERYRERGRERSRERSRSRSRSRSRDRDRRYYERRSSRRPERDERRHRDSSDEERSPKHRSRRSKSDREEDKKKNLTDEWLKFESQLAAKKKMLTETAASSSATGAPQQQPSVQPAPTEYYQDAYGNYYPVPVTQANTNSAYQTYSQYPNVDPNSGYPIPPQQTVMSQPQVYPQDTYPSMQQVPAQTSNLYNVPNTPVYNTQGQPVHQEMVYGQEQTHHPPFQPAPTAVPRTAVVYGHVPTQPSILSAISSAAVAQPPKTPGYPGQPVQPLNEPEVGSVRPMNRLPNVPQQPGTPRFPSRVPSTAVKPQRVSSPPIFSPPVRPSGYIASQTTEGNREGQPSTPTPSDGEDEEIATGEKKDEAEPQPSQPVTTSEIEESSQPARNVNRHLPIKLGFKQAIKDSEISHPPPSTSPQVKEGKPEKVKSRWRRFSELDLESPSRSTLSPSLDNVSSSTSQSETDNAEEKDLSDIRKAVENYDAWDPSCDLLGIPSAVLTKPEMQKKEKKDREKQTIQNADVTSQVMEVKSEEKESGTKKPPFENIEDNIYLCERKKTKKMKDVRRMLCDCTTSKEDRDLGYEACGEDCLNRMLYIECGSRCQCGDYCTNRRFQKKQYADVEPFVTDWKGMGLRTRVALQPGDFVMEYVGEVLDYKQFKSRVKQQSKMGQEHHYFMALNSDEVIDASYKGNNSRYMNHSCDPNCETQKWTVNGILRVGFFVKKPVEPLTELNFDYQFERYGKEAQKCYCGSENCRGFIGGSKTTPLRSTKKPEEDRKKKTEFEDDLLDEELEAITELENGLRNKDHVLNICRLMVRAESPDHRITILKCLQDTVEDNCLRLFLDYHGLELLWSWITDSKEGPEDVKIMILSLLKKLPITNKNILKDSKILPLICRLAGRDENDDLSTVTNPMGQRGETKSILSSSTGKDKSQKKRVKFADEASSSDNESHSSTTDTVGDSASGELEPEAGPRPKSESLYKQVLDKSLGVGSEEDQGGGKEAAESSSADSTNIEGEEGEEKKVVSEEEGVTPGDEVNIVPEEEKKTSLEGEENECEGEEDQKEEAEMKSDIELQAEELLFLWKDLKELFKIPKKQQVEERKRIEKELGTTKDIDLEILEMIQDKSKQRAAGWDTGIRKRKRAPPPPPPTDDEERKVLLPTPPKISKAEHRKMFEAKVKAREEMEIRERQQQEAFLNQFYSDPSNILYFNRTPNHPLYGMPPDQQLQILQSQPLEVQYQMVQGYNSQEVVEQYIDPNTGMPITVEQLQAMYQHQQQPEVMYTEDGQPIQQVWPQQQQVQQQYVNAEGQIVSVHQVDQHLVYSGVPQQQIMTQTVEVPGTQVTQIPGQTVYLQQMDNTGSTIGPYGTQTQLAVVPPVAIATTSSADDDDPPPPPSPPKPKVEKLPPNWKSAKDSEGKTYYYHTVTRQTQWDPPSWESIEADDAMDLESPLYEEIVKGKSKRATTAAADTSTEAVKRIKDQFRRQMSSYIVVCLNPFRKPDCKAGRISSTEDFKHLARKLTHHVMAKELKHCRHVEDLEVNENVKSKAKDYVKKYMGKFGSVYRKTGSPDI